MMSTSVRRWGSTLAIRIPKSLARQVNLEENTEVTVVLERDRIVVRRARKEWNLEELLIGVTPANTHCENDWG